MLFFYQNWGIQTNIIETNIINLANDFQLLLKKKLN